MAVRGHLGGTPVMRRLGARWSGAGRTTVPGNCAVTARSLQGMVRVRSGQAPAWPLVSGRRGCRGSAVKGGRRSFPEETRSALDGGGVPPDTERTILGPWPQHGYALSLVASSWTRWSPPDRGRAVAAGDGVHGEPLPLSAQDYGGGRHEGASPIWPGPGRSPGWVAAHGPGSPAWKAPWRQETRSGQQACPQPMCGAHLLPWQASREYPDAREQVNWRSIIRRTGEITRIRYEV
jgi:hypothetical protein